MKKVTQIIILVVVLLGFATLGYWVFSAEEPTKPAVHSIPGEPSLIIRINDFQNLWSELKETNLMWQELEKIEGFYQWQQQIVWLDSTLQQWPDIIDILDKQSVYLSIYGGDPQDELLLTIPVNSEMEWNTVNVWLIEQFAASMQNSGKGDFYVIAENNGNQLFANFDQGIISVSNTQALIENSLGTTSDSIVQSTKTTQFLKLHKTADDHVDANVYLNFSKLNDNVRDQLNSSTTHSFDKFEHYGNWSVLDVSLKPNKLILSGLTGVSNQRSYLALFQKQKPQSINIDRVLPSSTIYFLQFGVSNFYKYIRDYKLFLDSINHVQTFTALESELLDNYNFELITETGIWIGNEFGSAKIESGNQNEPLLLFGISNMRKAREALSRISVESAEEITNYRDVEIKKLAVNNLFGRMLGSNFHLDGENYYSFISNYLLISNKPENLKVTIDDFLSEQLLYKQSEYINFSNNISDLSNIVLYVKVGESLMNLQDDLNDELWDIIEENLSSISKFETFGTQISSGSKNLLFESVYLNFNPSEKKENQVLWEAQLDTTFAFKPKVTVNHVNFANEIFVQDDANNIYLIDNKGNVLWKKQLTDPIISEIYQIDVYNNNKLQYLFNTANALYLVDRKGRYVEGYPIKFPYLATNGITVLDYDKKRDYRILVALEGGLIYNYDRFGKTVKGWEFKGSDDIRFPIKHFVLNGKDYIVALTESGRPFVLNRRGEVRLKLNIDVPLSPENGYFLEIGSDIGQCKIVTSDSVGNIIYSYFNNEVERLNLDELSSSHRFVYTDVNNNGRRDIILSDSNLMRIYNHRKEKLFEIETENPIAEQPLTFVFNDGEIRYGLLDNTIGKIWLYQKEGRISENFPKPGNSLFSISDINKDGTYNLIVSVGNKLVVYNLQ